MPRKREPRYDKTGRFWYTTVGGKKVYLARDRNAAWTKFLDMFPADETRPAVAVTIAEAVLAWVKRYGTGWQRRMLGYWLEYAGETGLADLTVSHMDDFAIYLRGRRCKRKCGTFSPQTIKHAVTVARRVCNWSVDMGWVERCPRMPRLAKPIRRPRDYPPQELATVFSQLPDGARSPLLFILTTGCRPSEACRLRWEHIDWDRQIAVLPVHKTSRTGKPRTLFLTPSAIAVLDSVGRQTSGPVFVSRLGRPYTSKGLHSILSRRGISSVYGLRHTFAQTALDQGVSLEDVAALLGHHSLTTTQVYAQVRADRSRSVASRLVPPVPLEPVSGSTPDCAGDASQPREVRPRSGRKSATDRDRHQRAG